MSRLTNPEIKTMIDVYDNTIRAALGRGLGGKSYRKADAGAFFALRGRAWRRGAQRFRGEAGGVGAGGDQARAEFGMKSSDRGDEEGLSPEDGSCWET